MNQEIVLSPAAVNAVFNSVWTGPNCMTRGDFVSINHVQKDISLSSIKRHFDDGPDSFLIAYAVTNRKFRLDVIDIAIAYCIEHINMVWAAEQKFRANGLSDPYFEKLRERGYVLDQPSLSSYLYSCVGKAGKVVEIVDGLATVETNHCYLRGVVIPEGVKGSIVVVHFATAILALSAKEAEQISIKQDRHPWFHALSASLTGDIDYTDFCGGNLSQNVANNLKMLR